MNPKRWSLLSGGAWIILALAADVLVGAAGMAAARHDDKQGAKPISTWDIVEKLDGKPTKVTAVEVTLAPGQGGQPPSPPRPGDWVRHGGRV